MKLYEVSRKTLVKLLEDTPGPPYHRNFSQGEKILFDHTDGMYSLCRDMEGHIVHLPAWTEVEIALSPEDAI